MTDRFPTLHGLRGLLAMWVFISHIVAIAWQPIVAFGSPWNTLLNGSHAVDVFIILSGFVITHLIQTKPETYGRFIWRRFCRLYPIFLLSVTLALVGLCLGILPANFDRANTGVHYAVHLTLFHGLVPNVWLNNAQGSLLTPAWSVSLEWQFYLLAPFALALAGRSAPLAFLIGASCLMAQRFVPSWLGSHFSYAGFLPLKLGYFFLGSISWFGLRHLLALPKPQTRLLSYAAAISPSLLVLSFSHYLGVALWLATLGIVLIGEESPIARLFNNRVLLQLGTWSYSIYLLHELVLHAALPILDTFGNSLGSLRLAGFSIVVITATLLLSAITYRWIEKPGIALGHWSRRTKTKVPSGSSDA